VFARVSQLISFRHYERNNKRIGRRSKATDRDGRRQTIGGYIMPSSVFAQVSEELGFNENDFNNLNFRELPDLPWGEFLDVLIPKVEEGNIAKFRLLLGYARFALPRDEEEQLLIERMKEAIDNCRHIYGG